MQFFKKTVLIGIFLLFIFSASLTCFSRDYRESESSVAHYGTIHDKDINEASGIALSRRNSNLFWLINDSGNSPEIFAVNEKGERLGALTIEGAVNYDWEDITSFEYMDKHCIIVADVGDNFAIRKNCVLYFIEEPDIRDISSETSLLVAPWQIMEFIYEDGPRDCEAVAVDTINEKILLLTKRDQPPVLYQLPIRFSGNVTAERLGEIKPLPLSSPDAEIPSKHASRPTSMDILPDGSAVVVLTYVNAMLYKKEPSENFMTSFLRSPKEITYPPMPQAESVCFSSDGKAIFITTEQLPAPLYRIDLTEY